MIIGGAGMILFGIGNGWEPVGITNLWTPGGFFPGWHRRHPHPALVMVMYSYLGIEIIGVTAGEARSKSTIKKAIDSVLAYPDFLCTVPRRGMAIYPWDEIGHLGEPLRHYL